MDAETRQRLLNGTMFAKIRAAFEEVRREEGLKTISHTEAVEALRYAAEKLDGLPIQF